MEIKFIWKSLIFLSAFQAIPIPIFIVFCILFAMIIIVTIGLCIAASIYANDKRRNCDAYDRNGWYSVKHSA